MQDEAFIQLDDLSVPQHCLISAFRDVEVVNLQNDAYKTIPHQGWLSGLGKVMPYYSELDSGDILRIKGNYNLYAQVHYTLATFECSVKIEWIEALVQYQGHFSEIDLVETENTITEFTIENQPEIFSVLVTADETSIKPSVFTIRILIVSQMLKQLSKKG